MDLIIDSPLNKAHCFSRNADLLAERGKLDEASLNHSEAARHLLEALKLTNNKLAIESLTLQREYHIRKQHLLLLKKKHLLAVAEAERVEKEVMVRANKMKKKMTNTENADGSLQKAIYRTFDEADSLLELLQKKEGGIEETVAIEVSSASASIPVGVKKPKEDSDVIEELKCVNFQLRSLITQLMTELANSEKQVAALKRRVAELEFSVDSNTSPIETSLAHQQPQQQPSPDVENVDLPPLELPHFEASFS